MTKKKMVTILVSNRKGGVGKTTLARHLVFYGAMKGLRVLGVDLDTQTNFSTTFQNMAEENGMAAPERQLFTSGIFSGDDSLQPLDCGNGIHLIAADPNIVEVERSDLEVILSQAQSKFAQLSDQYDLCVIDTGAEVTNLLVAALGVANFSISPCKPDRDAITGLASFFSNVMMVRDQSGINPNLASLGVLPNQIAPGRAYHKDVLDEMRQVWGATVLDVVLYERAAIDLAKDRPVWQTTRGESKSPAAAEMKAVCSHIFERMGLGE